MPERTFMNLLARSMWISLVALAVVWATPAVLAQAPPPDNTSNAVPMPLPAARPPAALVSAAPAASPAKAASDVAAAKPASSSSPAPTVASAAASAAGQSGENAKASPLAVKIGNATFTPGGFMDFTMYFRSKNVGSGIGTSFGAVPYSTTPAGQLSEFGFSTQNSRISLKVDSQRGDTAVTGYVEADFLGNAPANLRVGSNSDTLRMRLYWVDVQHSGWELLAGQSWSLLTPNRKGISPNPADIFFSDDMDTNYQVGLTWSRQTTLRLVRHTDSGITAAIGLEDPDQYLTSSVVLPATVYASQVDTGSNAGNPTLFPDVVGKIALDTKLGDRAMHGEIGGVGSAFRIFTPAAGAVAASHSTKYGGGVEANGNFELIKNLHAILNSYYSDGDGRYIFALGPDFTIRPDGTISLVHAASGIAGLEYQATPASLIYAYYGDAYFGRSYSQSGKKYYGFGYPGSGQGTNRNIQEYTLGYTRTFWKSASYGALQLITQYSYLERYPWSVAVGQQRHAPTSLGYLDIRYVLP
jgi:hypothetical protein